MKPEYTTSDREPAVKRRLLIAIVLAMALFAAACGGSDADDVSATSDDTSDSADDDSAESDPADSAESSESDTDDSDTDDTDTDAADASDEEAAADDADEGDADDGDADESAPTATDRVLVAGTLNSPRNLNPATGRSGNDYEGLNLVYDTLISFDPATLKPEPGLVESWEYRGDDELEFVMTLRPGVMFHDGTELTAEAVKASLDYYKAAGVRTDLDPVTEIVVEGDNTIVLKLSQPYTVLPSLLADRAGMMISPLAIETDAEAIADNGAGTGPFILSEWTPDVEFLFDANPDYWDGAPTIGGINLRLFVEEGSMVSALTTGQIEYAWPIGALQLPVLDAAGLDTTWADTLQFRFLRVNQQMPPLDDVRVRQALNMAVDRDSIAMALLGSGQELITAHLPVPPSYWSYGDGDYRFDFDQEAAMELLAEAGHEDGLTVDVCLSSTTPDSLKEIQILEEQFRTINVTLNVAQVPGTGCIDEFYAGDWPMMLTGHTGRADAWFTYSEAWASWGANNLNNGEPIHPDIDANLLEIATLKTIDEQVPLYEEINALLIQEAPLIGLYYRPRITGRSAEVTGELIDLQGKIYLSELHYE